MNSAISNLKSILVQLEVQLELNVVTIAVHHLIEGLPNWIDAFVR